MKVTAEMIAKAKEVAKANKIDEVYVNEKGEFFTDRNHASYSVGSDPEKFAKITLSELSQAETTTDEQTDEEKAAAEKEAADKAAQEKAAVDKEAKKAAADKEKAGNK